MPIETKTLLSNIDAVAADSTFSYGEKSKGAGYHSSGDGVHTVAYVLDNFVGTVKIQGTLEQYPGDDDWVDIGSTEIGGDSSLFSQGTYTRTFTGKFVWIRTGYNLQNGTITEIRYNY